MNRLLTNIVYVMSNFSISFWLFAFLAFGVFIGFMLGMTVMANFYSELIAGLLL